MKRSKPQMFLGRKPECSVYLVDRCYRSERASAVESTLVSFGNVLVKR